MSDQNPQSTRNLSSQVEQEASAESVEYRRQGESEYDYARRSALTLIRRLIDDFDEANLIVSPNAVSVGGFALIFQISFAVEVTINGETFQPHQPTNLDVLILKTPKSPDDEYRNLEIIREALALMHLSAENSPAKDFVPQYLADLKGGAILMRKVDIKENLTAHLLDTHDPQSFFAETLKLSDALEKCANEGFVHLDPSAGNYGFSSAAIPIILDWGFCAVDLRKFPDEPPLIFTAATDVFPFGGSFHQSVVSILGGTNLTDNILINYLNNIPAYNSQAGFDSSPDKIEEQKTKYFEMYRKYLNMFVGFMIFNYLFSDIRKRIISTRNVRIPLFNSQGELNDPQANIERIMESYRFNSQDLNGKKQQLIDWLNSLGKAFVSDSEFPLYAKIVELKNIITPIQQP